MAAERATSLQYLVLDEFHTYDGAQGTDVAMLLRRLGLALEEPLARRRPRDHQGRVARPLGRSRRSRRRRPWATRATRAHARLRRDGVRRGVPRRRGGHRVPADLDEWVGDADAVAAGAGFAVADASRPDEVRAAVEALGADPDGTASRPYRPELLWSGDQADSRRPAPLTSCCSRWRRRIRWCRDSRPRPPTPSASTTWYAGSPVRRTRRASRLAAGGFDTDWSQAISARGGGPRAHPGGGWTGRPRCRRASVGARAHPDRPRR